MNSFEERNAWAIAFCRKARMRLTPTREAIVSFLAQRRSPASLEMVSQAEGVRDQCNSTTVYRTLMMFKEAELVRVVGTPRKASYFVLNSPSDSAHFLICRCCGCVTELPLPDRMVAEIERLASAQGFSPGPQDCEISGLCAGCQASRMTQVIPSKLIVRGGGKVSPSKRDFPN
ncbi:MAG TPA: transcriptional repressor [Candidatus Saccharimonadales bacterium]|nr:transcriptional repressor [Candidatus Saccharimonadales bacterium]